MSRTGTDRAAYAYASTAPHDGTTWTRTRLDGVPVAGELSCPTTTLCLAPTSTGVSVSRDPFAPSPTWTQQAPVAAIASLDCVSEAFCAAITPQGIVVSTDAGATWTSVYSGPVKGLSCASEAACFATLGGGRFVAWSGAGWTELDVPVPPDLEFLQCPAPTSASARSTAAHVYATRTPATAAPWAPTAAARPMNSTVAMSCYAVDSCALAGFTGMLGSGRSRRRDRMVGAVLGRPRAGGPPGSGRPDRPSEQLCLVLAERAGRGSVDQLWWCSIRLRCTWPWNTGAGRLALLLR